MQKGSLAEIIVELLKEHHFLSPLEIQDLLAEDGKEYNKTSVYRAIDRLLAEDLIVRQDFLDTEACYELRENNHDHLVCIECGIVQSIESLLPDHKKINDFTVEYHNVNIFGYCKDCQAERAKN